jgi:hypothetical protein
VIIPQRSTLDWALLGLLAALTVTNAAFLVLQRTGGPAIGLVYYLVLLALTWWAQRYYRAVMWGGLVGLAVHVVEAVTVGWSTYPMLMALNLVLPAALALLAWVAGKKTAAMTGSK